VHHSFKAAVSAPIRPRHLSDLIVKFVMTYLKSGL